MAYKDILAVITQTEADASALSCAEAVALAHDAHLSAVLVHWIPALPMAIEGWIVDARWGELVEAARVKLEEDRQTLEQRLARNVSRFSTKGMLLELGAARSSIAVHARHADLTVLARPKAGNDGRTTLVEAALFESGRPILLAPPDWKPGPIGQTVLVGWNAGREAARSLADALPLLKSGARIILATVDGKPSYDGHGDVPGADISVHLARHGFKVELRHVASGGRSASHALCDVALAENVDLVVIGGYGRSRMSEFVFGGVTRDMLQSSTFPILMSH